MLCHILTALRTEVRVLFACLLAHLLCKIKSGFTAFYCKPFFGSFPSQLNSTIAHMNDYSKNLGVKVYLTSLIQSECHQYKLCLLGVIEHCDL